MLWRPCGWAPAGRQGHPTRWSGWCGKCTDVLRLQFVPADCGLRTADSRLHNTCPDPNRETPDPWYSGVSAASLLGVSGVGQGVQQFPIVGAWLLGGWNGYCNWWPGYWWHLVDLKRFALLEQLCHSMGVCIPKSLVLKKIFRQRLPKINKGILL